MMFCYLPFAARASSYIASGIIFVFALYYLRNYVLLSLIHYITCVLINLKHVVRIFFAPYYDENGSLLSRSQSNPSYSIEHYVHEKNSRKEFLAVGDIQRQGLVERGNQEVEAREADRVAADRALSEMSKHMEEHQSKLLPTFVERLLRCSV